MDEVAVAPREDQLLARDPRRLAVPVLAVLLLFILPANLVLVGPLRSNGAPVRLLGLAGLVLAVVALLRRGRPRAEGSMAAAGLIIIAGASALTLGSAYLRPLAPEEAAGAVRALLLLAAAIGVTALMLSLRGPGEVDVLGRFLVAGAAFSALLGVIQFVVPFDWAALVRPPGFVLNSDLAFQERGEFTRVQGTSSQSIDFAVSLAALAPLALHCAVSAATPRGRLWARLAAALIVVAIPMSVSRSGFLALAVALVVYGAVWTGRQRVQAVVIAAVGVVFFRAFIPGLLGSIRSAFLRADDDPSIQGRRDDYDVVWSLVDQRPFTGLGLGTYRPDVYRFLDNQWLLTLVEGGVLGLLGLLVLFVGGYLLARGAAIRLVDETSRSLAQALAAGLAALAAGSFTFDLLSFQQSAFLTFVLFGLAGTLHRDVFSVRPRGRERVTVP